MSPNKKERKYLTWIRVFLAIGGKMVCRKADESISNFSYKTSILDRYSDFYSGPRLEFNLLA